MRKFLFLGSVLSLGMVSAPASAAELILGSGWQYFSFGAAGSSWSDIYTFTLLGSAELQVTDAFNSGDQFEVFINSASQGVTSTPTGGEFDDIGFDFDTAFSDPRWSSGSYLLGPGSYTVEGVAVVSPFNIGGAGIQLISANPAVPEPATWAMMLLGFFAVGGAMRASRRRQKITVSYA